MQDEIVHVFTWWHPDSPDQTNRMFGTEDEIRLRMERLRDTMDRFSYQLCPNHHH